ncbi:MAG: hypothetical protein IT308_04075 [Anaerolineaceae bacterium]|nr:hypothetical protein [Anaerolineaceae bacterium]
MKPSPKIQKSTRRGLMIWAVLASAEALGVLIYMALLPADPKNVVFLGYSLPRLGLMAAFFLLSLTLGGFAVFTHCSVKPAVWINPTVSHERKFYFLLAVTLLITAAGWVLLFLPLYRFGGWAGYAARLKPLFLWVLLFGAQTLVLLAAARDARPLCTVLKSTFRPDRAALGVLLLALLTWAFIALTGIGLRPDTVHWNDNGVPLLGLQVAAALALGIGLGWSAGRLETLLVKKDSSARGRKFFEIGIILAVWACAAFIWSQTPMQRNFFAPGPYPPTYEFYPFSDSVTYDSSAQLARIGLLYSGGAPVDKPLYSLFLLIVNFLSGNRYSLLLAWQAALLAALPAVLYQIGKTLHSRAAGFAAAALVVFKEINAYSILTIQVSHSKLILSEVPTALMLALFTLFMIRWLEDKGKKAGYAAFAGGTLGLSTLLRHNPWFLLPLVALVAVWVYRRKARKLLLAGGLFTIVFLLGIAPWAFRAVQTTGNPLYFFAALKGVVWEQRYEPALQATASPTSPAPPASPLESPTPPPLAAPTADETQPAGVGKAVSGMLQFVSAHFFHNLIASAFILPTQFILDDLQHTVSSAGSLYPVFGWDGHLNFGNVVALFASLATAALGIGAAWKRRWFAGLLPLLIFLGYSLASALARTSGGRYIVPVDWALILYYALGGVHLLKRLRQTVGQKPPKENNLSPASGQGHAWQRTAALAGGIFLLVGLALPVSERLISPRYPLDIALHWLSQLEEEGSLESSGLSSAQIEQFLQDENTIMLAGRALYPRFYSINEGEPDQYSPLRAMPFPRLTFTVIGPRSGVALLPLDQSPAVFPHGGDVLVIGCSGEYVDAAAAIWMGDQPGEVRIYRRAPQSPLECPLRQPVCDNNRNCQ